MATPFFCGGEHTLTTGAGVATRVIGVGMLVLPLLGAAATYLLPSPGAGTFVAARRARRGPTSARAQGTSTIFPWVWPLSTWRKASRT